MSFVTRLIRFYRLYVEVLVEQGELERALAVADSSRGRVLSERHGIRLPTSTGAPNFRRLAADSGRVLAAYWLAPSRSYLWVVDSRGVRMHALPPAAEIERLVREHQTAIHDTLADPLAPGAAGEHLYQVLVAPDRGCARRQSRGDHSPGRSASWPELRNPALAGAATLLDRGCGASSRTVAVAARTDGWSHGPRDWSWS